MKKVFPLIVVLCTCVTFFCERDTKSREAWPRSVEPRLSNASEWKPCRKSLVPGRVVEEAQCGPAEPPISVEGEICDEIIEDHTGALQVLSFQPHCTDAAIDALDRFGRMDPEAMSDLAAAYYVRAQREDRPSDFLRALDAAEQAIAAEPKLPAAHFNRALVLEALGLPSQAVVSWDQFLQFADSGWETEARQHRKRLIQSVNAAARWDRNRNALPNALRARDRNAVARLIAPFPSAAQRYFEEELLPQWAVTPTQEQLERVSLFADALSLRLNGDRFPIDVVAAIRRASKSPETLAALQRAHRELTETRRMEQSFELTDAAARYKHASELFKRAASPFYLRVDLGYSVKQAAVELLEPIEIEAVKHGYHDLRARVLWMRGHFTEQSSYAESLAAYDDAFDHFARINDQEGLAAIRTRRAGVLRGFGAGEIAWHDAFYAGRHAAHLINLKDRQALLLEAAAIANSLGHPRAAFLYQTTAMEELKNVLRSVPPDEIRRFRQLHQTLAMVLRHRAATHVRLGRHDQAIHDLTESVRLVGSAKNPDLEAQRILRARADEVRGQVLVNTDPDAAVAAYTSALANATSGFRSFRTSLLAQRAEAKVRAGRGDNADKDLQTALAVLRTEEQAILASRQNGAEEDLWSPYFSRFQDTYRLLIRRLVEKGDHALAFTYAERARAVEPLNLLLQLGYASPALLTKNAPADERSARASVADIQASLPDGTFVIQYCVLEDRTYVWIISPDRFEYLTLDQVGREKTNRWSTELQQAARYRSTSAAERVLRTAYAELAAEPLNVIAKMTGGVKPARLVFIPDGGIHGLPLVALRDPRSRDYLIQRVPIEIAGSATLYVFSLRRDLALRPARNPSIFIIGDPAFDERLALAQGMRRLDYAKSEAKRIGDIYAPHTDILLGTEATVPALLKRASEHAIVHVAGHAIVNAQTPSRSFLLLAPSPGHAGILDAEDLLKIKLDRTRLVILSTCSSAGGLPVGPEGVSPFVRPLLAAGVPAVIGSLWDVDDATTEKLMVSFHRHYQKGSEAAVAMRDAQLELLKDKNAGLRSVLAWAPFQVIGHASSPFAAHALGSGGTPLGIHSSNSVQRSNRLRSQ